MTLTLSDGRSIAMHGADALQIEADLIRADVFGLDETVLTALQFGLRELDRIEREQPQYRLTEVGAAVLS